MIFIIVGYFCFCWNTCTTWPNGDIFVLIVMVIQTQVHTLLFNLYYSINSHLILQTHSPNNGLSSWSRVSSSDVIVLYDRKFWWFDQRILLLTLSNCHTERYLFTRVISLMRLSPFLCVLNTITDSFLWLIFCSSRRDTSLLYLSVFLSFCMLYYLLHFSTSVHHLWVVLMFVFNTFHQYLP